MPKPFEVPAAPAEPSYRATLADPCTAIALTGTADSWRVKNAFDTLTQLTLTRLSAGSVVLHVDDILTYGPAEVFNEIAAIKRVITDDAHYATEDAE